VIYPVDSAIQLLNNWGLEYTAIPLFPSPSIDEAPVFYSLLLLPISLPCCFPSLCTFPIAKYIRQNKNIFFFFVLLSVDLHQKPFSAGSSSFFLPGILFLNPAHPLNNKHGHLRS